MPLVSPRVLRALLATALPGADARDLDLVTRATLLAHQAGHDWAGTAMLSRELARRGVPAEPATSAHDAGTGRWTVDAGDAPGPLALAAGTRWAGDRAVAQGIGAVGLRAVQGTGRLAPYVSALADRGLVGIVLAQSAAWVAPVGGTGPAIGTNPIAFAAPRSAGSGGAGSRGVVVVDLATSELTRAALTKHRATGAPLPAGTALDSEGRPTTDAARAVAIMPRGGLLGSATGLLVEVLAGALLGVEGTDDRGILVLALSPDRFGDDIASQVGLLADRWQTAGGHLPGAHGDAPLPAEIAVPDADWDAFLSQVQ
jgi:(2R)-3-sulfolactate dehydrogenase (NADP+)